MFELLLLLLDLNVLTPGGPVPLPPAALTYTDPLARPDVRVPVVYASPHPTTVEMYSRLPEWMRTLDTYGHLLKYLSLIGDQLGELNDLLDRLIPGEWPSDLTNPWAADPEWLPWLSQIAGVDLSGTSDVEAQRYLIANAANGHRAGTTASVQAAVVPFLSGNRRLSIDRNTGGDSWHVTISVYGPEVVDQTKLEAALESVRPAGVQFTLVVQAGISIGQLTGTIGDLATTYDIETIGDLATIPPP